MTYTIENGELYATESSTPIDRPSILIDPDTDTLLALGDYDDCNARQDALLQNASRVFSNVVLLELSKLPAKKQCYIFRRALEYSATGFCKALYEHSKNPDFVQWLDNEILRIPIN